MKKIKPKWKALFYTLMVFCLLSCKNETKIEQLPGSEVKQLQLKYAEGFSVSEYNDYKVITVSKPWPKSEKTYTYLVASKDALSKMTFPKDAYDGVIVNPIENIVVTSTTHIPSLELLGVEEKLVGFPGTDYISSEKTRQRIDKGLVRELGKNEGINTEVLLEIDPNLVVGFGIDGANKTFETIKKANIPVIYHGGWVESSALGKAEWIKFFGVLFNKEKEADSIFNKIEKDYQEAKTLAKNATSKPSVLSGAMTKDVWHLPNGDSPEAQFLKDANVNYLWNDSSGNGSLYLSFEAVLDKAKDADIWLSPSYYRSLKQMKDANPLYTNFDAFKSGEVYSFTNSIGTTGGNLYYELGAARPDLILKDIIKITHPELLADYKPYFFKKFED
ncbi:iron complex transport system substrate-binding protein [Winogradskyella wandonensis]|uniref:Iron complex transport system substrate-binding protein n=1 Tax=Winogradskyella wandonensis TaxID=1442586 RepID=A0A4R1KW42_9FLAO|nr:ABC transporter substrate-binding protein [Winogradskyella wandonensis]TCK68940.1 iron complex transport system substrate-binding protein [Winogradskyella wandonensis]